MSPFEHINGNVSSELALLRARVAELERAESERRETEAALRESRARLRTVVSNAPIVLFALDINGIFTLSEGKALETIGYKPGEAVGQSVFDIYKDVPVIKNDCLRALRGEVFTTVVELPGAAFETRYTPLRDAAGEVCGCIGVATDIANRLRAEKNLRQSEERFRMLAENIPGVIYLCRNDERFTMIYLNDSIERLTGYSADLFLNDQIAFADVIHPEDLQNVYEGVNAAVARRATYHLIYRVRRADGLLIWVEEYGAGVFIDDRLQYLEGYITDITQRVADEQALAQANEELERRVTERTANLRAANVKMLRTQEELAQVLRVATVGEMASGMAHELNQPLSAILNYIQGAKRRIESGTITGEELVVAFDKVAVQAQRAANILRTVRRYITRRAPAGTHCDLNTVVRHAVELAELDIRDHQVVVRLALEEPLPSVEADAVQVEQVILNLVRNGIEAMQVVAPAHRSLQISTRLYEGQAIETIIEDSGPGLTPEISQRIFEPFFSTKSSGLGMGLSISRSIIESYEGRIWFSAAGSVKAQSPEAGKQGGTRFHFVLPVARKTS